MAVVCDCGEWNSAICHYCLNLLGVKQRRCCCFHYLVLPLAWNPDSPKARRNFPEQLAQCACPIQNRAFPVEWLLSILRTWHNALPDHDDGNYKSCSSIQRRALWKALCRLEESKYVVLSEMKQCLPLYPNTHIHFRGLFRNFVGYVSRDVSFVFIDSWSPWMHLRHVFRFFIPPLSVSLP